MRVSSLGVGGGAGPGGRGSRFGGILADRRGAVAPPPLAAQLEQDRRRREHFESRRSRHFQFPAGGHPGNRIRGTLGLSHNPCADLH